MIYVFFFFFQAEDGIRDKLVTGVQTCALPISSTAPLASSAAARGVNAPATIADATSIAPASCLRTVRAMELEDSETTPEPKARPSTTAPAVPTGSVCRGVPPLSHSARLTGVP